MKTLCIVLAIIALIILAILFQEKLPSILELIRGLGWLGPLLFLLLYTLATVLFLPTMILTLAGGALFGPFHGTLFNLFGATLGAICAFCLARYFSIDWLRTEKDSKIHKLLVGIERGGWQFAALVRLFPVIPFNLVNYGLGLTKIKFSHYFLTTFIFLIPTEIVYTYCGHAGIGMIINTTIKNKSDPSAGLPHPAPNPLKTRLSNLQNHQAHHATVSPQASFQVDVAHPK